MTVETVDGEHVQTADDGQLGRHGLRRGVVSTTNVFGQAVAGIGPSVGASALIPVIFTVAVGASWLTILIGTVAVACIAVCISAVSRVYPSTGVLYELVPRGLGRDGALLAGATTVLVAIALGPFGVLGMGLTAGSLVSDLGWGTVSSGGVAAIGLAALAILTFLTLKDIRLSTSLFFRIEIFAMGAILLLLIIGLANHGGVVDSDQLSLSGTDFHGMILGVVYVVLVFGGFEGAAALGVEARKPSRAIPIALIGSVVVVGLFDAFNSYAQVVSLKGTGINLGEQASAFGPISDQAGVKWLGDVVTFGVFISFFAATAAWLNYSGRVVLTMAHDSLFPQRMKQTSEAAVPLPAILMVSGIGAAVALALALTGSDLVLAFGDIGAIVGYGLTLMYLLVSVAAPLWLWKEGKLTVGVAAAGLIGAGVMVLEYYYSFSPMPAYPINVLLWGFVGFVGLIVLFSIGRRLGLFPKLATAGDPPPLEPVLEFEEEQPHGRV